MSGTTRLLGSRGLAGSLIFICGLLGIGVGLNRSRDRVSCLLGPDTVLTRPRPHRDRRSTSVKCTADFKLVVLDDMSKTYVRCLPI